MPILFTCPSCAKQMRASDDKAGRKTRCPKCGTVVRIPNAIQSAPIKRDTLPVVRAMPDKEQVQPVQRTAFDDPVFETHLPEINRQADEITQAVPTEPPAVHRESVSAPALPFACPSCGTNLRAADDKSGRKARCPKCGSLVTFPSGIQEIPITRAASRPKLTAPPALFFSAGGASTCSCPHCSRTGIPFKPEEPNTVIECQKCGGKFTPLGGAVESPPVPIPDSADLAANAGIQASGVLPTVQPVSSELVPYVRCYDCGRSFREEDTRRLEVRVGRSSGSFGGLLGDDIGIGSSVGKQYAKVDLCLPCYQKRTAAGCAAVIIALALAGVLTATALALAP